ncbi:MFS transporter [Streptomyces sp. NPDC003077]|uniref:MFS transporter n=1 Tax=Streptomyces sp. NPDC003077 TaxID=3154443 RepID=UPI0033A2A6AB
MAFTTYAQPSRAGRREWIALSVLLLPCLLVSMDVSVLYFAVPFLTKGLGATGVEQLWILDIYGFVLAGLLIIMGALGDRVGRRRLLLTGAVLFGAASVLAAYAQSPEMLIGARALLGIGGATLMPSTLALIRNLFHDDKQRGTAVAIWSVAMTSGIAIGPVLSGVLLEHFWWGSVFLINAPAMVLLLVCGPLLLPEFKNRSAGRFDLIGAVLSLAAMLPLVHGIKELARDGLGVFPVLSVVFGLLAAVAFVWRQRTAARPMLDLALFRNRGFSGSVLLNLLSMFALVGFAVFFTQYLQSVRGMSPLEAALWNVVPTVAVGGVAPAVTVLARRLGRTRVIVLGFLISMAGFVSLVWLEPDTPLWLLLVQASLYAAGMVMVMTLGNELAIGAAPPERAGSASAVVESGTELGGALGMAILGSVGGAVYQASVQDALPAGLPPGAADAARETLAGAASVAGELPGRAGEALLAVARGAFTDGMHAVALGSAVVMALGALLTGIVLRGVRTGAVTGEPGGEGEPVGSASSASSASSVASSPEGGVRASSR